MLPAMRPASQLGTVGLRLAGPRQGAPWRGMGRDTANGLLRGSGEVSFAVFAIVDHYSTIKQPFTRVPPMFRVIQPTIHHYPILTPIIPQLFTSALFYSTLIPPLFSPPFFHD